MQKTLSHLGKVFFLLLAGIIMIFNSCGGRQQPTSEDKTPNTNGIGILSIENLDSIIFIEKYKKEGLEEPFMFVLEMPTYPGGDDALTQYLMNEIVYPESAIENNIQGRVCVRFCVTETGEIGQVQVLKGVDPDIDAEAIRVVKTIKGFSPGKHYGLAVPVWYTTIINFQLEN